MKMSGKVFLELVEMKAKAASVFPFLIGICYSWYHFKALHLGYVFFYFIAMFLFNMAVDILDNYNDYRRGTSVHNYKEKINIIGRENLSLPLLKKLIIGLITLSAIIGAILSFFVGWPLFFMGLFCYLVGIFYSSGPKPLSSLPLGEFFSGVTMGFMITLICVYLNYFENFSWNLVALGKIFLITLPNVLWIANLMLANNICDLEEDKKNNRYTLVYYLGKSKSLQLFVLLNIGAFLALIFSILFHLAPWTLGGTFFIWPLVRRYMQIFLQKQSKKETFPYAIKILVTGAFSQVVFFGLGCIFVV